MKTAFAYRDDRIAPVFDIARRGPRMEEPVLCDLPAGMGAWRICRAVLEAGSRGGKEGVEAPGRRAAVGVGFHQEAPGNDRDRRGKVTRPDRGDLPRQASRVRPPFAYPGDGQKGANVENRFYDLGNNPLRPPVNHSPDRSTKLTSRTTGRGRTGKSWRRN